MTTRELPKKITDPIEVRGYFIRMGEILGHLRTAFRMGSQSELVRDGEMAVVLSHLDRLSQTLRLLSMKYGYAGYFADRMASVLEIAENGRGFPVAAEIRRMENDRTAAQDAGVIGVVDLRAEMLDFILQERKPPRDAQFRQSQAKYARMLCETDPMGVRTAVNVAQVGQATRTFQLDWTIWDQDTSQPMIYVMRVEDTSPRGSLKEDQARLDELNRFLLNMSYSAMTPLAIAGQVDDMFPTLHPVHLKRVIIGPIMADGFCPSDECSLSEALSHVGDLWSLNWAAAWTVEVLRTKGHRLESQGLLRGDRRLQNFDIDTMNRTSVATGTTSRTTRLLVPYDVYQSMNGPPSGALENAVMFVVDPDGHVAGNM